MFTPSKPRCNEFYQRLDLALENRVVMSFRDEGLAPPELLDNNKKSPANRYQVTSSLRVQTH